MMHTHTSHTDLHTHTREATQPQDDSLSFPFKSLTSLSIQLSKLPFDCLLSLALLPPFPPLPLPSHLPSQDYTVIWCPPAQPNLIETVIFVSLIVLYNCLLYCLVASCLALSQQPIYPLKCALSIYEDKKRLFRKVYPHGHTFSWMVLSLFVPLLTYTTEPP